MYSARIHSNRAADCTQAKGLMPGVNRQLYPNYPPLPKKKERGEREKKSVNIVSAVLSILM